jgi:protease I
MAKVAVPLAAGFEDSEFTVPRERLLAAGHEVVVLGLRAGETAVGKRGRARVRIEAEPGRVEVDDFDALLIPGGHSPDHLRHDRATVDFVRRFYESGKPVAAICHGPQLLVEAGVVSGRTLTSWPSVSTEIENAGANWIDNDLVEDENLITSRKPEDLEIFCKALLERI